MNSKFISTTVVVLALFSSCFTANSQVKTTDSIHRQIQISFVPYFGTNGLLTDKITNDVSINIIGGSVYEVTKCEVGGMFNIDKNNVGYCQLAGIGNIVGGKVSGFQAAGNFNVANAFEGIQVAGLLNTVAYGNGMQLSGLINHAAKGEVSQIAGLVNNTGGESGLQIAGLINNSPIAHQFQIAGLVNHTRETPFQIAGLVNNSQKTEQFQIAGLVNNTQSTFTQISGLINNSNEIKSAQIAGLVNNAETVNGIQISGLINRARKINGVQIGVLNIADTCNGIPIGVLNLVKNGYHTLELSGDELIYSNIAFRTGVSYFHTILTAGIQPNTLNAPLWAYGGGIGSLINLSEKNRIGIDVTFQHILKEDYVGNNHLYKIGCGFDRKLGNKAAIYLGLTYNFLMTDKQQSHYADYYKDLAPYSLYETDSHRFNLKSWAGFKVGFRFF